MKQTLITKIVSGGQTGADRGALDAAIAAGMSYGGWLPKGRKTEEGPLPDQYALQEMESSDYRRRTRQNVIDSDGTLIFSHGALTGGSLLTEQLAKKLGRPNLHINCDCYSEMEAIQKIAQWVQDNDVRVLNVAGPRASGDSLIYDAVRTIVLLLLTTDKES